MDIIGVVITLELKKETKLHVLKYIIMQLTDKPQTKSLALPTTGRYLVLPSALKA